MARVWSTTQAGAIDILNGANGAFAYAGLTGVHAESGNFPGTGYSGVTIHGGEGTTSNLVASFAFDTIADLLFFVCVSPDGGTTRYGTNESYHSTSVKIIATKTAVAIMNPDSNGISKIGLIITKDKAADSADTSKRIVGMTVTAANKNLADPAVVPVDPLYSALVSYTATTSLAFGCTTLAKIPAPTFNGTARYLDTVCFAHAAQYAVDGAVTLNNVRYYSIGGSWYLRDTEE